MGRRSSSWTPRKSQERTCGPSLVEEHWEVIYQARSQAKGVGECNGENKGSVDAQWSEVKRNKESQASTYWPAAKQKVNNSSGQRTTNGGPSKGGRQFVKGCWKCATIDISQALRICEGRSVCTRNGFTRLGILWQNLGGFKACRFAQRTTHTAQRTEHRAKSTRTQKAQHAKHNAQRTTHVFFVL